MSQYLSDMNERMEVSNWPMRLCEAWLTGGNEGFIKLLDVLIKTREAAVRFYKREKKWLKDVGVHEEVVEWFKEKFKKQE